MKQFSDVLKTTVGSQYYIVLTVDKKNRANVKIAINDISKTQSTTFEFEWEDAEMDKAIWRGFLKNSDNEILIDEYTFKDLITNGQLINASYTFDINDDIYLFESENLIIKISAWDHETQGDLPEYHTPFQEIDLNNDLKKQMAIGLFYPLNETYKSFSDEGNYGKNYSYVGEIEWYTEIVEYK